MWIPAHTTRPPFRTAFKASGTSAPSVAKTIASSSGSGGISSDPPAQVAPRLRAKADAVAFGILFIAKYDLPRRFALKAPLNEPDTSTFY
jgi:2,4-dienoyl-CoA reductase-like NADH-dependent reductase (Old Yellow Enzyme family)